MTKSKKFDRKLRRAHRSAQAFLNGAFGTKLRTILRHLESGEACKALVDIVELGVIVHPSLLPASRNKRYVAVRRGFQHHINKMVWEVAHNAGLLVALSAHGHLMVRCTEMWLQEELLLQIRSLTATFLVEKPDPSWFQPHE